MTRRTAKRTAALATALLPLVLTGCILQERSAMDEGPALGVELVNRTSDTIWVVADDPSDSRSVEVGPGESRGACFGHAEVALVLDTDPDAGPQRPTPAFTLPLGESGLCGDTYRWDGSTLSQVDPNGDQGT